MSHHITPEDLQKHFGRLSAVSVYAPHQVRELFLNVVDVYGCSFEDAINYLRKKFTLPLWDFEHDREYTTYKNTVAVNAMDAQLASKHMNVLGNMESIFLENIPSVQFSHHSGATGYYGPTSYGFDQSTMPHTPTGYTMEVFHNKDYEGLASKAESRHQPPIKHVLKRPVKQYKVGQRKVKFK